VLFEHFEYRHPVHARRLHGHTAHALLYQPGSHLPQVRCKQPKQRTGSGSRSGLTATQCSLPPTPIPASGCTVAPVYENEPGWLPLATNKYGAPVSGAIIQNRRLKILIFPIVTNQASFLCELFDSVLPELVPHLFPEHVGAKWVEDPRYELTNIVALKEKILEVEASARKETEMLTQAIVAERAKMSFQHDLLRETGDKLVAAVKTALAAVGFKSVMDSDQLVQPGGRRREDLQIHDRSPVLLVEIKGIGGLPPDHDAIQVGKYIAPRMKEWNRTDVTGISL
jgi:hypothetical protein